MNRRRFLKLFGLGTAGVAATALVPSYSVHSAEPKLAPKLNLPGDVKFYSQSGRVQLLWDESEDYWEFSKDVFNG